MRRIAVWDVVYVVAFAVAVALLLVAIGEAFQAVGEAVDVVSTGFQEAYLETFE